MDNPKPYKPSDLDEICIRGKTFINKFSNSEVLVAGSTGFIGSWIIAALNHANRYYNSNIQITGLSRGFSRAQQDKYPTANFIKVDVSKAPLIIDSKPACIFNAATPASPSHGGEDVPQILSAAIEGTRNLINLANSAEKCIFINLSSGIVTKRENDFPLSLGNIKDAYLEGKRISEKIVKEESNKGNLLGTNFRLYAFAGPGISLTDHFAVGNFVNDASHGRPITIKGNPSTIRSYLYPTDLVSNLFNLTCTDSEKVIEIGSSVGITMFELANLVNRALNNKGINQVEMFGDADEYLPKKYNSIIDQKVNLEETISRWGSWLGVL